MDEGTRRDQLVAFVESHYPADALTSPEAVQAWFAERGLVEPGTPATAEDVVLARHLRGALRSLFGAHTGRDRDERTAVAFEAVMTAAPLAVRPVAGGSLRLEARGFGVARALGELLVTAYAAVERGEFDRYKACAKCGSAFYDTTKNRSRVWCSMALCGDQEKAREYRKRKAAERANVHNEAHPLATDPLS